MSSKAIGLGWWCLVSALLGAGCASVLPSRPEWIAQPKSDDSICMYRLGQATGQSTREAAKQAAYQDALVSISREILSQVKVENSESRLTSALTIRGAEILPGIHFERAPAGHSCWLQVAYPLAEKAKLLEQIELGERLTVLWTDARAAANAGDYGRAQRSLAEIVAKHAKALALPFEVDEAKILLGDTLLAQKSVRKALQCYKNVEEVSTSPRWKEVAARKIADVRPPRFWPMSDRWGGRKVALLCAIRDGKECRPFAELANVLIGDCASADLACTDVSAKLTAEATTRFFDKNDFSEGCRVGAEQGAGILLAVLYDIDGKKRGTKTQVPLPDGTNYEMAVLDSDVEFYVVQIGGCSRLYNGQFAEVAGNTPESRLAGRAASILIEKRLVPECPAVGGR